MTARRSGATAPRLRWWREVVYILAFYAVYSFIRNQFGSAAVEPVDAFSNAKDVIGWERAIGLFHEETLQEWFLGWRWFIQFWNIFYGSFHFVVTATALIWMFRKFPQRYPRWRNTLAFTTALALIGFATFPLMPPRLLPEHYGFVDTLAEYGGLWSFDSGAMQKVSNQYAAMPSLHFGWSAWSFFVLYPQLRNRLAKVAIATYPWLTLFAIMVTANHYWIDAAAGAAILVLGYGLAVWFTNLTQRSRPEPSPEPVHQPDAAAPSARPG